MRLVYLTANAAWVFTFGDQLVRLENADSMFFASRADAVAAAREHRLGVSRAGVVSAI